MSNSECPHENDPSLWRYVSDWEGDPATPGCSRQITFWECRLCGESRDEMPAEIDMSQEPDDDPGPIDDPDFYTPYEARIFKDGADG